MRDFEETNRNFTDMLSRNIKRLDEMRDFADRHAWPTERKAPNHSGPDIDHGYGQTVKGE